MRLNQGRIGKQESVSVAAMAIVSCAVFMLDSQKAYTNGNATYVSLPLSMGISLLVFLLIWAAMKRTGSRDLVEMMDRSCGKAVGGLLAVIAVTLMLFSSHRLLERFTSMIHSFVMVSGEFTTIAVWITGVSAFFAIKGMECTGRIAKIFAAALALLTLFGIVNMTKSLDFTRLSPFPGDLASAGRDVLSRSVESFPALLGLLCIAPALQGMDNVKKTGIRAVVIAAVVTALIQLGIGMVYVYSDLKDMYMPIYRLKMILTQESYWFRLDKLSLFIWLISCVITAAFYIYAAALVVTRRFSKHDVRPATVSLCAITVMWLYLANIRYPTMDAAVANFFYDYACLAAAPFGICALIGMIRFRKKGRDQNEKA